MYMHLKSRWTAILLVLLTAAGIAGARRLAASEPEPTPTRALGVDAARAALESGYERSQRFVGRVEFAQASDLSFELGGKVARVLIDEGDRVEAGAAVAELDTERLRARRAELVAARVEARSLLELAELRDGRARFLLDEDVIAPQQADDTRLEAAARAAALARVRAQIASVDVDLAKSVLRAPFAGEVSARHVDAGVVVGGGEPILRLLETARAEVRVGVSRAVAAELSVGERVSLEIDAIPYAGRVLAVLPERHGDTRTVSVRARIEEPDQRIRQGDLAVLRWREPVDAPGFWLPRAALTEGSRGLWVAYVATPDADGHARLDRRPVELLHEAGERVYVRGALREGEPVVQRGVHRLVPGQLVHLSPSVESPTASARLEGSR